MLDIDKIKRKLVKYGFGNITVSEKLGGIRLEGELADYNKIIECGRLARNKKSRGVINDIKLKGYAEAPPRIPLFSDKLYEGRTPDVLIVGGGVVGSAIAREISKYNLKIMLLEKEYDLATAASSRNDGMIHAGVDLMPGSVKLKYCLRGNALYDKIAPELGVPIKKKGQYVLFTGKYQRLLYPVVKLRCRIDDIPVEYLSPGKVKERIKNPGFDYGGMFFRSAGVVSPYLMTVALAEHAALNGAEICLNTAVLSIENDGKRVTAVHTNRGTIYPKILVNAAGVFSDKIAESAGDGHFTIHPRRGLEIILDKKAATLTDSVIGKFAVKSSSGAQHTKGGGIVNTIDGNILVGPGVREAPEREDDTTSREEFEEVFSKQNKLVPDMRLSDVITYFTGTRAATYEEQFVVEKSPVIENLLTAAGIQSPGLTAAPAIAEDIAKFAAEILSRDGPVEKKAVFLPRKIPPDLSAMELGARDKLIKERPDYGVIICRCEEISKGEILDAIRAPIPATTLDAIKRRTRAGMGRCQGGFCSPQIVKIIAEELGIDEAEVMKKGRGGRLFYGHTRERAV
jgi:Predicted dehydrogenase